MMGLIVGSVYQGPCVEGTPKMNDLGLPSSPIVSDGDLLMIMRHGHPASIPPHMIDHRANVKSLVDAGVSAIVSICSSGALRPGIRVPSIAVPEDYFDLWSGATVFDSGIFHATPGLDRDLREASLEALSRVGTEPIDGGVYVQTRGPRLETASEVRFLSTLGDYVGMNLGSEATIACELGVPFAGVLTVDNHAHGVMGERPDFRRILEQARSMWDHLREAVHLIPGLYAARSSTGADPG